MSFVRVYCAPRMFSWFSSSPSRWKLLQVSLTVTWTEHSPWEPDIFWGGQEISCLFFISIFYSRIRNSLPWTGFNFEQMSLSCTWGHICIRTLSIALSSTPRSPKLSIPLRFYDCFGHLFPTPCMLHVSLILNFIAPIIVGVLIKLLILHISLPPRTFFPPTSEFIIHGHCRVRRHVTISVEIVPVNKSRSKRWTVIWRILQGTDKLPFHDHLVSYDLTEIMWIIHRR
jgi:hypothetical protein